MSLCSSPSSLEKPLGMGQEHAVNLCRLLLLRERHPFPSQPLVQGLPGDSQEGSRPPLVALNLVKGFVDHLLLNLLKGRKAVKNEVGLLPRVLLFLQGGVQREMGGKKGPPGVPG